MHKMRYFKFGEMMETVVVMVSVVVETDKLEIYVIFRKDFPLNKHLSTKNQPNGTEHRSYAVDTSTYIVTP